MTYSAFNDPQHIGNIYINPGSGPVDGGTLGQAVENAEFLLDDIGLLPTNPEPDWRPWHIEASSDDPVGGRWRVYLRGGRMDWRIPVCMPGLPLEQVRYMKEEGQNVWDFPRLFVGKEEDSWVWKYAIGVIRDLLAENGEEIADYAI